MDNETPTDAIADKILARINPQEFSAEDAFKTLQLLQGGVFPQLAGSQYEDFCVLKAKLQHRAREHINKLNQG